MNNIFSIFLFEGLHQGKLIGDSGYACRNFLMTPYRNPQLIHQQNFNTSLTRSRVRIEQTFGVLKRRFSCLHHESRMQPERVCQQVMACAILHNIAMDRNDIMELPNIMPDEDPDFNVAIPRGIRGDGQRARERLALEFFN